MARLDPRSVDWATLGPRFWPMSRVNRIALVAGALWAVLVLSYAGGYFGGAGGGQARGTAFLDAVFFLVALVLPLGLVGLAAWLAAELARQRQVVGELVAAAAPLIEALTETRRSLAEEGPLAPGDVDRLVRAALAETGAELQRGLSGTLGAALDDLRAQQTRLDSRVARIAGLLGGEPESEPQAPPSRSPERRPAVRRVTTPSAGPASGALPAEAREDAAQPALPEMAAEPAEALAWEDLVRALDFPRDAADAEGFAALKQALRHHSLQRMLQAAEDVMNILSQEKIFMEDLAHRPGPAWAWRAFIEGRRGDVVGAAGGIRHEQVLSRVRQLMKSDPIFRDTALVFLRRFDAVLRETAPTADDAALLQLVDTRSGRAFMLIARVSGSFD